jgi:hypothetical protein
VLALQHGDRVMEQWMKFVLFVLDMQNLNRAWVLNPGIIQLKTNPPIKVVHEENIQLYFGQSKSHYRVRHNHNY